MSQVKKDESGSFAVENLEDANYLPSRKRNIASQPVTTNQEFLPRQEAVGDGVVHGSDLAGLSLQAPPMNPTESLQAQHHPKSPRNTSHQPWPIDNQAYTTSDATSSSSIDITYSTRIKIEYQRAIARMNLKFGLQKDSTNQPLSTFGGQGIPTHHQPQTVISTTSYLPPSQLSLPISSTIDPASPALLASSTTPQDSGQPFVFSATLSAATYNSILTSFRRRQMPPGSPIHAKRYLRASSNDTTRFDSVTPSEHFERRRYDNKPIIDTIKYSGSEVFSSINGRHYQFEHEEAWGAPLLLAGSAGPTPIAIRRSTSVSPLLGQVKKKHFFYNNLPLELRQHILAFLFERFETGEAFKTSVIVHPVHGGCHPIRLLLQLPSSFKQLFVSKTFHDEALPVLAMTQGLHVLQVQRDLSRHANNRLPSPIRATLRALVSRSTQMTFPVRSSVSTSLVLILSSYLPQLQTLIAAERHAFKWSSEEWDWTEPELMLSRRSVEALLRLDTAEVAAFADTLHRDIMSPMRPDTYWSRTMSRLRARGFTGTFLSQFDIYCGVTEDNEIDKDYAGEMTGLRVTMRTEDRRVTRIEETDSWRRDLEGEKGWGG